MKKIELIYILPVESIDFLKENCNFCHSMGGGHFLEFVQKMFKKVWQNFTTL